MTSLLGEIIVVRARRAACGLVTMAGVRMADLADFGRRCSRAPVHPRHRQGPRRLAVNFPTLSTTSQ